MYSLEIHVGSDVWVPVQAKAFHAWPLDRRIVQEGGIIDYYRGPMLPLGTPLAGPMLCAGTIVQHPPRVLLPGDPEKPVSYGLCAACTMGKEKMTWR
jgi:hypothetical protein